MLDHRDEVEGNEGMDRRKSHLQEVLIQPAEDGSPSHRPIPPVEELRRISPLPSVGGVGTRSNFQPREPLFKNCPLPVGASIEDPVGRGAEKDGEGDIAIQDPTPLRKYGQGRCPERDVKLGT